ncbi:hypothetical protein [Hymenobacter psychrophilus]|uniref:Uncharacterized protein n=1 Tax=Hymenobacter psychrophilus TaxID=651662 RepID=A0A1H3L769_9BACT|nr:hypothetical protein [Hymenobacter psychrophilus]SDY60231.1 hypothetical protein SAMN04488069_110135 [Hymenobacter psychrophilus]
MKTTLPASRRPPGRNPVKSLSSQPPRRTEFLPPLDPASQQLEREADASMTLDRGPYHTGQPRFSAID